MDEQRVSAALSRLTADGVLSEAQAHAVRAALDEQERAPSTPPEPGSEPGRGIHPVAEAAAWVGAVLATVAGLTATSAFWAQLERWAQAGILLLAAIALLAAGLVVRDDTRPAARRILSVVWFLAVGAFGAALVVGFGRDGVPRQAWPRLAAAAAATGLALPLWRRHPSALQLIALTASSFATLLALLGLAERPPSELYGLLAWALGAALVLLALGRLARPHETALLLGTVLTLGGAQALVLSMGRWGVVLLLVTVAALFALGGALSHTALTGAASLGLAALVPQALEQFFPDSLNASATLFLSGIALLAGALATIRRAAQRPAAPGEEAP